MHRWWQQTALRKRVEVGLVGLGIWTLLVVVAFIAIPGGLAVLAALLGLAGGILWAGWLITLWLLMRDRGMSSSHKGVL